MAVIWTEVGARDAIPPKKTNGTSSAGIGIVGRGRVGYYSYMYRVGRVG